MISWCNWRVQIGHHLSPSLPRRYKSFIMLVFCDIVTYMVKCLPILCMFCCFLNIYYLICNNNIISFLFSQQIPALTSFCLYATWCMVCIFFLQCTLFVACLALDQRRADAQYDACLCCYRHKNYEPTECSQTDR